MDIIEAIKSSRVTEGLAERTVAELSIRLLSGYFATIHAPPLSEEERHSLRSMSGEAAWQVAMGVALKGSDRGGITARST
jgi:hypothetical protein